ncbi:IS3 family transposase [Bacillus thuringiensis]
MKTSPSFTHLKQQIKHSIKYYNHHTYQSNLNKITPLQYTNHLLHLP